MEILSDFVFSIDHTQTDDVVSEKISFIQSVSSFIGQEDLIKLVGLLSKIRFSEFQEVPSGGKKDEGNITHESSRAPKKMKKNCPPNFRLILSALDQLASALQLMEPEGQSSFQSFVHYISSMPDFYEAHFAHLPKNILSPTESIEAGQVNILSVTSPSTSDLSQTASGSRRRTSRKSPVLGGPAVMQEPAPSIRIRSLAASSATSESNVRSARKIETARPKITLTSSALSRSPTPKITIKSSKSNPSGATKMSSRPQKKKPFVVGDKDEREDVDAISSDDDEEEGEEQEVLIDSTDDDVEEEDDGDESSEAESNSNSQSLQQSRKRKKSADSDDDYEEGTPKKKQKGKP